MYCNLGGFIPCHSGPQCVLDQTNHCAAAAGCVAHAAELCDAKQGCVAFGVDGTWVELYFLTVTTRSPLPDKDWDYWYSASRYGFYARN